MSNCDKAVCAKPLISVIVPVYNMESFLECCVRSVLQQSYSNIELILVDDGSGDASAVMCDQFAQEDSRVRVHHKPNGGQGTARNVGIDMAKGEYIAFLDSDDAWHKEHLSTLYSLVEKHGCDIATCAFQYVNEANDAVDRRTFSNIEEVYAPAEAMKLLLTWKKRKIDVAPWAKLFAKHLWNEIRFVQDRFYEDLATTYKVFAHASKVCHIDAPLMDYRIRSGSDIHSAFLPKKMVALQSANEIVDFVKMQMPEVLPEAESRVVATAFFLWLQLQPHGAEHRVYRQRCEAVIRQYRFRVMVNGNLRNKTRIAALLSYFGMDTVRVVFWLMRKLNPVF